MRRKIAVYQLNKKHSLWFVVTEVNRLGAELGNLDTDVVATRGGTEDDNRFVRELLGLPVVAAVHHAARKRLDARDLWYSRLKVVPESSRNINI